jgi:hemolysin-activating ACP:hemolysin acyltransferase
VFAKPLTRPKVEYDGIVTTIKSNVSWIEAIVSESKGMEVLNTRTYALHAGYNVEIMWNILVAILQDDFLLVEGDPGNPTAIDCAAVISDKIRKVILAEELQDLGFFEKAFWG